MKVNRQDLINALQIVKPGLANKERIEQTTSFAFQNDKVITYNDSISISHPLPGIGFEGAVKAEELYKLLDKLKQDDIEIEVTKNEVRLTSGKAKAGLLLQTDISLPLNEIENQKPWKKVPDRLKEALTFTMFSCSRDMSQLHLTGIHVTNEGRLESCDTLRITTYQIGKLLTAPFLIPVTSVQALVKYDFTSMAHNDGWIHFKTDTGTIFSCRLLNEKYVGVSEMLDVTGAEIVFPKGLDEILTRAIIFATQENMAEAIATITIADKKIKVHSAGSSGWFEETANMRYSGDDISFIIHPVFFQDIIKQASSCIIGDRSLKFTGEHWVHVVALEVQGAK